MYYILLHAILLDDGFTFVAFFSFKSKASKLESSVGEQNQDCSSYSRECKPRHETDMLNNVKL